MSFRKPRKLYSVQHILSGATLVTTGIESSAAKALEPGTVWGWGWDEPEAKRDAAKKRARHLSEGYPR